MVVFIVNLRQVLAHLVRPSGTVNDKNTHATRETGEPPHAGNAGGRSLWFRWTAPSQAHERGRLDGSSARSKRFSTRGRGGRAVRAA
jgi:hypothetical protein